MIERISASNYPHLYGALEKVGRLRGEGGWDWYEPPAHWGEHFRVMDAALRELYPIQRLLFCEGHREVGAVLAVLRPKLKIVHDFLDEHFSTDWTRGKVTPSQGVHYPQGGNL